MKGGQTLKYQERGKERRRGEATEDREPPSRYKSKKKKTPPPQKKKKKKKPPPQREKEGPTERVPEFAFSPVRLGGEKTAFSSPSFSGEKKKKNDAKGQKQRVGKGEGEKVSNGKR